MKPCPYCQANERQVKAGRNKSGSQRWRCQVCRRRYTPEPSRRGCPEAVRQQAVELYVDGMNYRRIARHLHVSYQSVINWVNAYSATLPPQPPQPLVVGVVELDELFTFVGEKKTSAT